jgi:hypothetical protein
MVMIVVHKAPGIIIQHKVQGTIIVNCRIEIEGADNFCCLDTGLLMLTEA